jgi:hypothetical protein
MRKAASQSGSVPTVLISSGSVILALCASLFFFTQVVFAWSTQQSVSAYCEYSVVKVAVSFKNTEPANSGLGMNVIATDVQTNKSVNLGTIAPGQTKEGTIDTQKTPVTNGTVKFDLTWSNGNSGVDSRIASYGSKACDVSSPSPTASPSASPTVAPIVSPTETPTATPVVTASPTVTPTATPVVTVSPAPTNEPPRTDLTDNRSDGRKDSLDCVSESQSGRKSCNEVKPVVAGVSTDRSLPTTGEEGSIFAVLSLFAVVGGLYVKMISNKAEQKFISEYEKNRKVTYAHLA